MDTLTLSKLKYADVLGRPLSKSIYRQLPRFVGDLYGLTEDDGGFRWAMIPHGRVNYCPPECAVETHCACEGPGCRRRPACRTKRAHQHLLIGAEGTLYQGFTVLHHSNTWEDDWPWLGSFWAAYEPLSAEDDRLAATIRDYRAAPLWLSATTLGGVECARQTYDAAASRSQVVNREMLAIQRQSLGAFNTWLTHQLATLPIVLLR